MNDTFFSFQNESTLILVGGVATVVLLIIVLIVVVAEMRVKGYKEKFLVAQVSNKSKIEYIHNLERELQEVKIKNASNEQELQHFEESKVMLQATTDTLNKVQTTLNTTEKELSQTETKLEGVDTMYNKLLTEHEQLQARYEATVEDNNKFRTNNARLLIKLENEERYNASLTESVVEREKPSSVMHERDMPAIEQIKAEAIAQSNLQVPIDTEEEKRDV